MADSADETEPSTTSTGHRRAPLDVAKARTLVARVVWGIFVLFAVVMALAALFIALDANAKNNFVNFVLDFAKGIDLGVFDLDNPIKSFTGANADTKNALLNYGIAAVVYLIVGRVLERLIRP